MSQLKQIMWSKDGFNHQRYQMWYFVLSCNLHTYYIF